jgi:lipopolysaccharide export system permease protein
MDRRSQVSGGRSPVPASSGDRAGRHALAILLKRSDVMTTFGRVFLPILILYYPVFMGTFDRAKVGALPPFTVWLANLALAALGLVLLRRVIRY